MSNLLDKSSIVLTPTAYDNGKVLCVKPSDGSGDFDFSRNSAATRVNAQGLVEDVQILSSNLVQNGDFSQLGSQEITNGNFSQQGSQLVTNGDFATDSDWTKGTGWSISGGSANCDGTQETNSSLRSQTFVVGSNPTLKLTFDVTNYSAGILNAGITGTGQADITNINANGTYSVIVVSSAGNRLVDFVAEANFIGSIDNCSVVEVGQDWTLGTGWSIGDSVASCDGTQTGGTSLYQSALQQNKSYKITFSITSITAGGVGVVNSPKYTTTGTFTYYYNVTGTDSNLYVNANTDFIGSVTNISVKEVGQNWTFPNDWEVGNNKIIGLGSGFGGLTQTISLQNKKIKVTFDILDYVSGTFRVPPTYRQDGLDERFSGNGSYEIIYTSLVDIFTFQPQLFDGSITNIKIIEISDDTNLPRISYENFSYQDALGSELIVNGDFATDSNWTKLNATISGGLGNLNGVGQTSLLYQNILIQNKKYSLTFDVLNYNGAGQSNVIDNSGNNIFTIISNGKVTLTFTHTELDGRLFFRARLGATYSIDNVSVKEYLGQEVVPDSGCGSWLWEPQSTNLIPYSELFSNSAWGKTSISVLSNVIASPSGEINASKIVESNTSGFHFISDNISVLSGANTFTFYSKAAERTQVSAFFSQSGNVGALFDLTAETATPSGTGNTANIESVGNGWYRCIVSNNGSSQISNQVRIGTNNGALGGYQGDGTSGLFIWGAQVEQQTYATSYIPTSGQASGVTRNKDVCTNGGSVASINSTEGVLYAEIKSFITQDTVNPNRYITLTNDTSNERVALLLGGNSNQLRAIIFSSTQSINLSFTTSLTEVKQFNKLAIKYKSGDYAFFLNGIKIGGSTETNIFSSNTLNDLSFDVGGGTQKFFGKTKALAVWKEALSDEELAELTTI